MSAAEASRERLLLVEDSETQALLIRRRLEAHGFAVERVASAEAALDRLNEQLPDLVVSDYHLPGISGGELARRLRLNAATRSIPVLMLTEASEPGLEREGIESGADAYVPKSADTDLIVLRIRALLRRPDRGAEPKEKREANPAGGAEAGAARFRRARILLLASAGAEELEAVLLRDGQLVQRAADPDAARTLLQREPDQDCLVVDLLDPGFDGLGFCLWADGVRARQAAGADGASPAGWRILGLGGDDPAKALVARAFEAGVDDLVPRALGPDAFVLRLRAVVRRKLLQDEAAREDAERRAREQAVERAQAEAAANAGKAALAEALEQANGELEAANVRLKEAQGKLVQSAKMASLGELVAGIAHEINNPLAFILAHQGTVERLLARLVAGEQGDEGGEERRRLLGKAHDRVASMSLGLKRIQDLVLNLRRFSRLDESEQQSLDVPDAIDTILALLTHKLGPGITVERRYDAPRELMCQPALLNQVVMNIVGNAADAINSRDAAAGSAAGQDRAGMPLGHIAIATAARDGMYVIEISDNGPGVPAELRERVFEPFFTTKPVGSGTGLGLAIAYSVVQAHGGRIAIGDAPDGGALFTVCVPLVPAQAKGRVS
jgi:two-component system, NtrC family, sensor kinase